ncbi:TetR/AcrR family transcriptional regulator [Streptomyces antarcticus]|uniref:TetR/AcrR family transcriptional regulator n=1 Tax=Streptomyces antarcticus TaxID=2996458 RepID=UPI00226FE967|nr:MULTISPECIES: TetR/AcrR family transcriptional regulator [unclassified Streptomyces]MCY0945272.1 TetR/AcrR family transcriptional regulator [Streptomyces sp. H34-AA3]MCZ4083478.1 TetR/AcrR family transcriptional regulator [Streptomyces sp. H34-S5]
MARTPLPERRRQLTEAAIRVMTREGVARATTRSISAEAGVSLSVFHYCFDSKQALFESVITAITDHYVTVVKEAIRPRPTLRETIRAGFEAYWDHVRAHPGEHMLTYELTQYALRQPGFGHLARRQYELYGETYAELIERLRGTAAFDLSVPVPVLARYLAAMTDGFTLSLLVLGDDGGTAGVLVVDTITEMITAHVVGLVEDAPAAAAPAGAGPGGP